MSTPSASASLGQVLPSASLGCRTIRILAAFRIACWLAGATGIGCAIYLTLRPSSILSEVPWLPGGLARWADSYGRLRNLPAYAVLAVPFMVVSPRPRSRAISIACLALVGAILEGLQYFLPSRWCEWQDVAWSWCGLGLTWATAELCVLAAKQLARSSTGNSKGGG